MAATGLLADAWATLQAGLTAAGFTVTTDPRQVRPRTILLQLPTMAAFNGKVLDITCDFQVVSAPTNDQAGWDWLVSAVDTVHDAGLAVLSAEPVTLSLGGQDLPAYSFTVRIAGQRA